MISAGDFRNGKTIDIDGTVYQIIEFQHVKPGKGAAFVRTKLKDIKNGGVVERTFRPTEKFPEARIERKTMQYLYKDDEKFYFMDPESFEQYELAKEMVGEMSDFMKDGDEMEIQFYNGTPINLQLPKNIWLAVTYTETAVKGDTTSSVMKDATLETGVVIKVPAFIKEGDIVSVDIDTYAYRERKK